MKLLSFLRNGNTGFGLVKNNGIIDLSGILGDDVRTIKIDAYKESRKSAKTLACTATFTFVSVKKLKDGSYVKINHNKQP